MPTEHFFASLDRHQFKCTAYRAAWPVLYEAQKAVKLATSGPYAYVCHPQYFGFITVLIGFLLQWPTLLTSAMFPVLVWMYFRLAKTEEQEAIATFGESYREHAARFPLSFRACLKSCAAEKRSSSYDARRMAMGHGSRPFGDRRPYRALNCCPN